MQTVAADGSATQVVRGDGTYRVYAFLQPKDSRRASRVRRIEPAEIEVNFGMGPNVFDVRLPQHEIARTLVELVAEARNK